MFTSAFGSVERLLLSFNYLLQRLLLLISLEHLPCDALLLHLQFPSACLFGFIKCLFCISVKQEGALVEELKHLFKQMVLLYQQVGDLRERVQLPLWPLL